MPVGYKRRRQNLKKGIQVCTSKICDLSGDKRQIGPCKFLHISDDGKEDCCPF